MSDFKSYKKYILSSLKNDNDLIENIYLNINPVNLKGSALICPSRCSMEINDNNREDGMTITNDGLLSIEGSGSTTVQGSVQSELNKGSSKFEFYKILFFTPQIHKIDNENNDGELHIIFKDTNNEDKYQVNIVLFNENNDNSGVNDLLSQKLMDEYVLNNIPDKSKQENSITRSSQWYLTDLLPNNASYFSYILPDNNDVLMVLYEKSIILSSKFISALKDLNQNNYEFDYDVLPMNVALFYTFDPLNNKDKIELGEEKIISDDEVIRETLDQDKVIEYKKNINSEDFESMIDNYEKENTIKENLNQPLNYDKATNNKCDTKKNNNKKIFLIIFLINFIILIIVSFYYFFGLSKYAKFFKYDKTSDIVFLDGSEIMTLFFDSLYHSKLKDYKNTIMWFIRVILITYIVLFGISLFTNIINNNNGYFITCLAFSALILLIFIYILVKIFFFKIEYIISKNEINGYISLKDKLENIQNQGLYEKIKENSSNFFIKTSHSGIPTETFYLKKYVENLIQEKKNIKFNELINQDQVKLNELQELQKLKKEIDTYKQNLENSNNIEGEYHKLFKDAEINPYMEKDIKEELRKQYDNLVQNYGNNPFDIQSNNSSIDNLKNVNVEVSSLIKSDIKGFIDKAKELLTVIKNRLNSSQESIPNPPEQVQSAQLGGGGKQKKSLYKQKNIKRKDKVKEIIKLIKN